jgi:hypothetical protein
VGVVLVAQCIVARPIAGEPLTVRQGVGVEKISAARTATPHRREHPSRRRREQLIVENSSAAQLPHHYDHREVPGGPSQTPRRCNVRRIPPAQAAQLPMATTGAATLRRRRNF